MLKSWAWIAAVIAIPLLAAPVPAQEATAGKPPSGAPGLLRLLPEPSTTRHVINLGERSIAFTAAAGTLPLRDAKGETTAEIFHVAYVTDPPSPERPITFVSNGGPGAASAFLHLGAVGPRLVAFSEAGAPLPPQARAMAALRPERRLAAVLVADVVGYSRLMGRDETGTLARLRACRYELLEPLLTEYRGRIVNFPGDNALCEFASVVDAVECAVAIQRAMAEREQDVPEPGRLRLRIGINLGDILADDGDVIERAIRPIALGRKNSLFAGSNGGARHWAIVASLVATAKLNEVGPLAWLTDVLERMVSGRAKAHELERLLPWNWKAGWLAMAALA
jgi:hypothetical protein